MGKCQKIIDESTAAFSGSAKPVLSQKRGNIGLVAFMLMKDRAVVWMWSGFA
jgi:hypothetical protein